MSADLGLPPRRELPDDVRARLRAELPDGQGKRRRVAWYAAAAAVVVLAAGAVVVTQQVRRPADVTPGPVATGGLRLDAAVATSSLDRCWAAVRAAGKTGSVPDRADWVPLFTEVQDADAVVAATAAGKPMFCETTGTTVTLSDPAATPAYAPGSRSGILLHSATGLVGGVVDPAWTRPVVKAEVPDRQSGSADLDFSPVTRQFVMFTRNAPARTRLTIGDGQGTPLVLPPAPEPLLSVTDRPTGADRTSAAGRALGDCLAASDEVLPDAGAYRPGPTLEADDYRVVMGRWEDRVVVCTTEPDYQHPGATRARAYPDLIGNRRVPARALRVDTLGGAESGAAPGKARTPVPLALPATADRATLDFGSGATAEAGVADGMALVWLPTWLRPDMTVHVVARDAQGKVVYDGSLRLG